MGYTSLYVWVEGPDDVRFFDNIIKPLIEKKYNKVIIRSYANLTKEKINSLIKSIIDLKECYIYVKDINNAKCITKKKREIRKELKNISNDRIVIIVKEIESWYLAGLGKKDSKNLGIKYFGNTDNIIKEKFNSIIPKKFDTRQIFMLEILNRFSIKIASKKNRSFEYFIKKYNCEVS